MAKMRPKRPPPAPNERHLAAAAARKMSRKAPAEDDPGWKWHKQGNRMASAAHAKANPPPKRYGTRAVKGGNVEAYERRALKTRRK
jgi:hypothetical protein